MKYNFFNAGLILTPEVFIEYKKVWDWGQGPVTMNFYIPPCSFTVILLINFDFQHFLT